MSNLVYRECEICGKKVEINSNCAEYNMEQCPGDPWKVIETLEIKVKSIKAVKSYLEEQLETVEDELNIQELILNRKKEYLASKK